MIEPRLLESVPDFSRSVMKLTFGLVAPRHEDADTIRRNSQHVPELSPNGRVRDCTKGAVHAL